jgi:leucyl-tRNA synthetase
VREALESLVIMLTPFAPHVAEEMWEGLGHSGGLLSVVRAGQLPIPSSRAVKSWRFRFRSTANCGRV